MNDSGISTSVTGDQIKTFCLPVTCQLSRLSVPHIYKNLHRAAADHALFTGFVGGEAELVQRRAPCAQCRARFGPDFGLDAATADRARHFAIGEEEHLRTASLRRRAARVRDGGDDDALAAR